MLGKCVLQLLEATRERVHSILVHSKRALFYLLLHNNNHNTLELVSQHISTTDPTLAKQLVEYAKRILVKVAEELDNEEKDEEK